MYYPYSPNTSDVYRLWNLNTGATAVFNDPYDPNYVGTLTEVTGLDSADVRESADDLTETDGGRHGNFYYGRRPITLTGIIYNHTGIRARMARLDLLSRACDAMRGDSQLSWRLSGGLRNLLTNPSFETNAFNWAGEGSSGSQTVFARQTGWAHSGTASLRVTATGVINGGYRTAGPATIPTTPGQSFAGSVAIKMATSIGTVSKRVSIEFFGPSGFLGGSTASVSTSNTNADVISVTAVAPAGATSVRLLPHVYNNSGGSATLDFYIDAAMLVQGNAVPTYFDSSIPGYYEDQLGTSSDYIEMYTSVRQQQPLRISGGWNKTFQVSLVAEQSGLYSLAPRTATSTTGSITVENQGSGIAYPTISLTRTSGSAEAYIQRTTGPGATEFQSIVTKPSLALAVGEKIEFSTRTHTARFTAGARNGQSANKYIDYVLTNWPTMIPANTTTFTTNAGFTMTFEWRDTWR